MGIRANVHIRNVDLDELEQQIKDLLESNVPENSKTGIHNLLGEIKDEVIALQDEEFINNYDAEMEEK
jgi:hypothetical protein